MMYKKYISILLLFLISGFAFSQEINNNDSIPVNNDNAQVEIVPGLGNDTISISGDTLSVPEITETPVIVYSMTPKEYEIAGIAVSGAPNYEDFILIGFSGLEVGQKIKIPGDEITGAIKKFWKQGLFSDVQITASKIEGSKIWLNMALKPRPRIAEITYVGLKKSEKEDLESKVGLIKGNQITPNLINRTKEIIQKHFGEKGFLKTEVDITQQDDGTNTGNVNVVVVVDKKKKVKVAELQVEGNQAMKYAKIDRTMKKTNPKGRLVDIFRTKKYIKDDYDADKIALIEKYNELGYRDAVIVADSVTPYGEKNVKVYIKVDEGKKYYFRDVTWVGNTLYSTEVLDQVLRIKKGDVYNTKKLNDRISNDEDAASNLYLDNGYLFFHLEPVEANIVGDSIDVEMRIYEGKQAVYSNIYITGNTRVYENVVRRELRTKPGQLFSKTELQRSLREIAQMGHFDPEKLQPDIQPNVEDGTVDVTYALETKSSDQFEISAGWGSAGIIGSAAVKFTNFSIQNLFKPSTYRIVPQGDGQTLTLRAQTNAKYYQSYGISFMEPWLGGKRPTSLSVSAFYSIQTGVSDRYYSSGSYQNSSYYSSLYGDNYYNNMVEYDDEKYIRTFGASVGIGSRLSWPDDYFTLYGELSYQRYNLQNWNYFIMSDGKSNNLNLSLTFARNSINNPYYPSSGSNFALSVSVTPPYSLFDGRNYDDPNMTNQERYEWVEYHKWKIKARTFTPLTKNEKLVLMMRADFGFLGYFNKNKRSPFETFYMGGDGMTSNSYSTYAIETISMRGYESGVLTPYQYNTIQQRQTQIGNLYTKLSFELRYPLLTGMTTAYVLAFFDAGNCWYDFKDFNPFQFKRSAGIGLRVILPMIGLIGVDWGYGFDPVKDAYGVNTFDYSKGQFQFVLGQEF